jgi:hypothetical protein
MADLVLVQGLPGGPYRLTITESCDGSSSFLASEMCACPVAGGAPHWHEVASAASFADLVIALLDLHLQGTRS